MASVRSQSQVVTPTALPCATCGSSLAEGAGFCGVCGTQSPAGVRAPARIQPSRPSPLSPTSRQRIETMPLAILSLLLGLLAYGPLPLIGAVGAVVAGHSARKRLREPGAEQRGQALATAGLALGYVQLVLAVLAVIAVLVAGALFRFIR